MNLCTVPTSNGSVTLGGVTMPVPAGPANGEVVVGLRPESLELAADGLPAEVQVVEEVGADAYVFCVAEVAGTTTKLVARGDVRRAPARGQRVSLRPLADEAHLFRADTGERLSE
jgi:multiple sugar transport system ATP-binding protein